MSDKPSKVQAGVNPLVRIFNRQNIKSHLTVDFNLAFLANLLCNFG